MDPLPARLAQASLSTAEGTWQRHVPAKYTDTALVGRAAIGRWGTEGGLPVLYPGRPTDSVVVEAYRHLIDPIADPDGRVPGIRPRVLVTCEVSVSEVFGLAAGPESRSRRSLDAAAAVGDVRPNGLRDVSERLRFRSLARVSRPRYACCDEDGRDSGAIHRFVSDEAWFELPADPRKRGKGSHLRIVE
jgi:hypothetical protein